MLPDDDQLPSALPQPLLGLCVTGLIPLQLLPPPFRVGLGTSDVGRTRMPEAASTIDRDTEPRKRDVDCPPKPRDRLDVNSIPETATEERPTECEFERCVPPPLSLHPEPSGVR